MLTLALPMAFAIAVWGQAKKPTLMVVPSDNYCADNGFMATYEVQGQEKSYPDYKKAMQNSDELRMVITKMGSIMADRGFPLKDLEQELKNIETEQAERMVLGSQSSGAEIHESPIDRLKRTASADIILNLDFQIKRQGPRKYITFNLRGLDSYTNKQIAGVAGAGEPSSAATPDLLLEEAVLSYMDKFNAQLMDHFETMFEKGREVNIVLQVWDNAMIDFYTEFTWDGITDELGFLLEDWLAENTVEGRFTTATATATKMEFEQVRIPLYFERRGRKRAMDTRRYVSQLRRFLRDDPFNIEAQVYQRGLGEAWLILGEK